MPKKAKELSAVQIRRLVDKGFYAVGGVAGLHLQVNSSAARSWILRTMVGNIRRDIGLGGYPDVSLADARERAREMKESIRQGIDPVEQRKEARRTLISEQLRSTSFIDMARLTHNVKTQEFNNKKHASQWITTLETYVFPKIGHLAIDSISVSEIVAVLEPIWATKTDTATRIRQRIATIFDHALAMGLRTSSNPALWKGCLEPLLPAPQKIKKRQGKSDDHYPALSVDEIQGFMKDLIGRKGEGARALEFLILTAARTGEVLGATWKEINFDDNVWEIPAERMKSGRRHRVPLSSKAVDLLTHQKLHTPASHLVFTSHKTAGLSNGALLATIDRMHESQLAKNGHGYIDKTMNNKRITAHGFRSTFKDWARRGGKFPDEWSELALAHVNSDQTRAAYARDELLNDRVGMMELWSNYIYGQKCSE